MSTSAPETGGSAYSQMLTATMNGEITSFAQVAALTANVTSSRLVQLVVVARLVPARPRNTVETAGAQLARPVLHVRKTAAHVTHVETAYAA